MSGAFEKQIEQFVLKVQGRSHEVVKSTVIGVHARIDRRSPVATGRFRGNWQLGIGSAPGGTFEVNDKSGESARTRITAEIPAQAAGLVYYIANNLPYAQRLEDGWSKQAPSGMVSLTLAESDSIIDAAVANAKAKVP